MIDVGQHLSTSLRPQCSLLLIMCVEHAHKTLLIHFLVHLCPGFVSLVFPAHFLKSQSRTLQPARPSGTQTDQRCAHTQMQTHTHTHTHTHTLFFPLPFLWPYSCLPLPATSGWGARYLSSRLQLHSICGQLGTKTLTDLNTMDFSSAHSRISVTVQTLQMWSSRCFVSSTPGACKHKQSANWYVFLSSFCTTRRLHI